MATAKAKAEDPRGSSKSTTAAKAPAAAPRRKVDTVELAPTHPEDAAAPRRRKVDADDPMVTVTVPRPYRLQAEPGVISSYTAGVQEMPKSHAEHQYSVDNGVAIYKARKAVE